MTRKASSQDQTMESQYMTEELRYDKTTNEAYFHSRKL